MSDHTRGIAAGRVVRVGEHELTFGENIEELRDSNALLGDAESLRKRMDEDGYLLIRGFHEEDAVLAARREVLTAMEPQGIFLPDAPLMEARVAPANNGAMLRQEEVALLANYLDIVESPKLMRWFSEYLGGEALTFDNKWVRATSTGGRSGFHYDIVYMGLGTENLYTCWTPLGEVTLDMGPLLVCLGSRDFAKVRATYGKMDVDRDNVEGHFSKNPHEIIQKYGGHWATAEFQAGDIIIFGMFLLHGSLENVSDRHRISCDTRYQLASEKTDERWLGKNPRGHNQRPNKGMKSMAVAREEWGV